MATNNKKPKDPNAPKKDLSKILHGKFPHSSVYYNNLSPEEQVIWETNRRNKIRATKERSRQAKTMREYFDNLIMNDPAKFLTVLSNMTVVQMGKALEGDTQAYQAVMSNVMSKPTEIKQVTQTTDLSIDGLSNVNDDQLEILLNDHLQSTDEDDNEDTDNKV